MRQLKDENATESRQLLLSLFKLMSFHARRRRDSFFFTISISFVNIETWFELWFIFDFVMQWISLFCSSFVMNIRSIVLWKWRVFQMIVSEKRMRRSCACWTTSSNWFVASCWINLIASLHNEWCKLKSFNNMCSSSSIRRLLTVSIVANALRVV